MNRRAFNSVGFPGIPANTSLNLSDKSQLISKPFILGSRERAIVEAAIRNVCEHRSIELAAINDRTNHAHVVLIASPGPERIMNSFKARSTRRLRELRLVENTQKVWARHRSTRWLWTDDHVDLAIRYVLYGQGDELPKF